MPQLCYFHTPSGYMHSNSECPGKSQQPSPMMSHVRYMRSLLPSEPRVSAQKSGRKTFNKIKLLPSVFWSDHELPEINILIAWNYIDFFLQQETIYNQHRPWNVHMLYLSVVYHNITCCHLAEKRLAAPNITLAITGQVIHGQQWPPTRDFFFYNGTATFRTQFLKFHHLIQLTLANVPIWMIWSTVHRWEPEMNSPLMYHNSWSVSLSYLSHTCQMQPVQQHPGHNVLNCRVIFRLLQSLIDGWDCTRNGLPSCWVILC